MIDVDKEKIEEYKKLIKEKGSKKATEDVQKKGISYNENFTDMHVIDPIFSDAVTSNFKKPFLLPENIEVLFNQIRLDGNIYPVLHIGSDKDPQKLPYSNSIFDSLQCVMISDEDLDLIATDSGMYSPLSPDQLSISR